MNPPSCVINRWAGARWQLDLKTEWSLFVLGEDNLANKDLNTIAVEQHGNKTQTKSKAKQQLVNEYTQVMSSQMECCSA